MTDVLNGSLQGDVLFTWDARLFLGTIDDLPEQKVKVKVASDSLQLHGLYSPRNSPGQNTGVGSLMQRADSLEKTLRLGKIEGGRRSGRQRMRWLDGITDSMEMSLGKLLGVGDGQGGLTCCSPWGCKESDTTERLNWTEPFPSPGDLPNPGIEHRSLALQTYSLPAEPQGKPKNTGVGSLSFLQRIFPIQEGNQSLLHCRWILYQLSYQGSPTEQRTH